jgi:phytoene dehydrogenase-like protein
MSREVLVIGAGLAGLNCAKILKEKGFQVKILEASSRSGGRMATDFVDGFTLDHGFQVVNPAYPELISNNVVEKLDLTTLPKGIEIQIGNRFMLLGDPRKSLSYLPGDLSAHSGNLLEKLRFVQFLITKAPEGDLGTALKGAGDFYQKVIRNFLMGVFLSDPDYVSAGMAKELLYWFVKGNPGLPRTGAQALPNALAQDLEIEFDTRVTKITESGVVTNDGVRKSDFVVVAADEVFARELLNQKSVQMNSSTTWYHAVELGEIESKHLRLDASHGAVNTIALSNGVRDYAPSGKTLISTTTLKNQSEEQIKSVLSRIWQIPESKFQYIKHYEIRNSLPKHPPGKPLLSPVKVSERVFAAGDYLAVPSQQGALLSGRLAAEALSAKS